MFQALEDNQVALSTMKASRFVKAFEKDVDHWERCLSLILEVIEMVLTVQRQWMYLEVSSHTAWGCPCPCWSLEIGLFPPPETLPLTLVSVSYIPPGRPVFFQIYVFLLGSVLNSQSQLGFLPWFLMV